MAIQSLRDSLFLAFDNIGIHYWQFDQIVIDKFGFDHFEFHIFRYHRLKTWLSDFKDKNDFKRRHQVRITWASCGKNIDGCVNFISFVTVTH